MPKITKQVSAGLLLILATACGSARAQQSFQPGAATGANQAQPDEQLRTAKVFMMVTQAHDLMAQNDLQKAVAVLQEASKLDPTKYSTDVHNHLGLTYERMNNIDGSITEYKKALETATGKARDIPLHNLANMNNSKGRELQKAGQVDAAKQYLEEAIRLEPTNPLYHNNYGSDLQAGGDLEGASLQYQKALESDPHMELATMNLANCYVNLGRFDQAKIYFRKFAEDHPQSPQRKFAQDQVVYLEQKNGPVQDNTVGGDYLKNATEKGFIRWPAHEIPLKVFIATGSGVEGFRPYFQQALVDSLNTWSNASGNKLAWVQVSSPQEADIVCGWAPTNAGFQKHEGEPTEQGEMLYDLWVQDGRKTIRHARMTIATLNSTSGHVLTEGEAKNVTLHESGHALGLVGHSPNYHDIMFFITNPGGGAAERNLTARDAATINLLYSDYPNKMSVRGQ